MLAWLGLVAVLAGLFFLAWLLSVVIRDVSIVDILWGPAFVVVMAYEFVLHQANMRALVVAGLVILWSGRLALHLAVRARGRPEDHRYAAMRQRAGSKFVWTSLFTVFFLQAALVAIVSLPLQSVFFASASATIGLLDWIAVAVVITGIVFESVADWQLRQFQIQLDHRNRVLDTGLWRYSRHPNYFGEAVVWWGFAFIGLGSGAPLSLLGPLVMTVLLLRVSGVTLLESTISERRPAYVEYQRTTSAFVPLPRSPK